MRRRFSLGWWYDIALITGCLVFLALSPGYVRVMAGGLGLLWLADQAFGRPS